jgi:hypothetical protein
VTVDLAAGTGLGGDAEGDTLLDIENLDGSGHDDSLTGDSGANIRAAMPAMIDFTAMTAMTP